MSAILAKDLLGTPPVGDIAGDTDQSDYDAISVADGSRPDFDGDNASVLSNAIELI